MIQIKRLLVINKGEKFSWFTDLFWFQQKNKEHFISLDAWAKPNSRVIETRQRIFEQASERNDSKVQRIGRETPSNIATTRWSEACAGRAVWKISEFQVCESSRNC